MASAMAEVVSGVGPGVEACEMASCQADGACVVTSQQSLLDAPRRKRRSARNVIARRFLAQFDAGGQPVTVDNLTWALEFADVAIDALYDAGLRVTPYLCRTCERLDIKAVRA